MTLIHSICFSWFVYESDIRSMKISEWKKTYHKTFRTTIPGKGKMNQPNRGEVDRALFLDRVAADDDKTCGLASHGKTTETFPNRFGPLCGLSFCVLPPSPRPRYCRQSHLETRGVS